MPQDQADYRAGQICAVLANIHRTKDAKTFEATDFFPAQDIARDVWEDSAEVVTLPDVLDLDALSKPFERMLGKKEDK